MLFKFECRTIAVEGKGISRLNHIAMAEKENTYPKSKYSQFEFDVVDNPEDSSEKVKVVRYTEHGSKNRPVVPGAFGEQDCGSLCQSLTWGKMLRSPFGDIYVKVA